MTLQDSINQIGEEIRDFTILELQMNDKGEFSNLDNANEYVKLQSDKIKKLEAKNKTLRDMVNRYGPRPSGLRYE